MKQFTLLHDALPKLKKRLLMSSLYVGITLAFLIIVIPSLYSDSIELNASTAITLMFVLAATALVYFSGLKRLTLLLRTYRLTITDDGITRETQNMPTITIRTNEIREINAMRRWKLRCEGRQFTKCDNDTCIHRTA